MVTYVTALLWFLIVYLASFCFSIYKNEKSVNQFSPLQRFESAVFNEIEKEIDGPIFPCFFLRIG